MDRNRALPRWIGAAASTGPDTARSAARGATVAVAAVAAALAALAIAGAPGHAAASSAGEGAVAREGAVRVFLDCPSCDEDYLRDRIVFVNFVRERQEADVHVLVVCRPTGAGGWEHTLAFVGQGAYADVRNTVTAVTPAADSADRVRRRLAQAIEQGLLAYAARTPLAERLSVSLRPAIPAGAARDRWDAWVGEVAAQAWLSGERSQRAHSWSGSLGARRVTEASKFRGQAWLSQSEQRYRFGGIDASSLQRARGAEASWVRSLGSRWSAGGWAEASASTYANLDASAAVAAALEHDIYPYAESTRRQLRISYLLGLKYLDYRERTIYDRAWQWAGQQRLQLTHELIETWGSLETSLQAACYLHDFRRYNLAIASTLSLRVAKGLAVDVNGSASRVHDQIALPRGPASEEDVLLRRRQMETDYQYSFSLGLSYTFGSIFNNVVNPRFGSV